MLVLLSGRLVFVCARICLQAVMGPGALHSKAEGDDEVLSVRFIGAKHGNTRYYYRYDIRYSEVFGDTMQHYCMQHGLSKQFGEGRVHFYHGEARCARRITRLCVCLGCVLECVLVVCYRRARALRCQEHACTIRPTYCDVSRNTEDV